MKHFASISRTRSIFVAAINDRSSDGLFEINVQIVVSFNGSIPH